MPVSVRPSMPIKLKDQVKACFANTSLKWEKCFIPALKMSIVTAGIALEDYGTNFKYHVYSGANHMLTGDEVDAFWAIPSNLDRCQPIRFQVVFRVTEKDINPDWRIKYNPLAIDEDADVVPATALDDTIPYTTDGVASGFIRETFVGQINGHTLEHDEEFLALRIKLVDAEGAEDDYGLVGLKIYYAKAYN